MFRVLEIVKQLLYEGIAQSGVTLLRVFFNVESEQARMRSLLDAQISLLFALLFFIAATVFSAAIV